MRTRTGAIFYYTMDGLGSTILLTDSAQATAASYAYDSWGNTTATGAQAAANPWQYAGGYKDAASGYTKFGARYYDAIIGRFTQPDPSSREANRYGYLSAAAFRRAWLRWDPGLPLQGAAILAVAASSSRRSSHVSVLGVGEQSWFGVGISENPWQSPRAAKIRTLLLQARCRLPKRR